MSSGMKLMDRAFYFTESDNSPKHVAGLLKFTIPEGKDYHYVLELYETLRTFNKAEAPFNQTVVSYFKIPFWFQEQKSFDCDYHIKIHEVENLDDIIELNTLVVKLHEERLDKSKPLWQCHLIYCKKSRSFSIYSKIHHVYADGVTLLSWIMKSFSVAPGSEIKPFWAIEKKRKPVPFSYKTPLKDLWGLVIYFKDILILFFNNLVRTISPSRTDNAVPFSGKRTVLTGKVTKGRVFSSVKLPLNEIVTACKLTRTTVNDFLLTVIDIATHRFLKDYGHDDFEQPLVALMPVSLRRPGDTSGGNKIAIALIKLAYGRSDPYKRLRQVVNSNFLVKQEAKVYSPAVYTHISIMYQTFALLVDMVNLSEKLRPLGNLLVSNVPGPKEPLFFGDSQLNSICPVSTLAPGGGLNVTLVSYNGEVEVGLLCCNNKVNSLEPLTVYIKEAFELLVKSIDDPDITIDDLGEKPRKENLTIVEDSVDIL